MNLKDPPPYEIKIRNRSYSPILNEEGLFLCPVIAPPTASKGVHWRDGLKPHERLFYHQTMASVRTQSRFLTNPRIPKDSLDFQLQAIYRPGRDYFPEKIDVVLQKDTCDGMKTFRVLRNTQTIVIIPPRPIGHPIRFGGIKEKVSPHSLKLINSSQHSQFVNNGFSRQPADGNFFRY